MIVTAAQILADIRATTAPEEPDLEYLSTAGVARMCGVTEETVRSWARNGRRGETLPFVRTETGSRRFLAADVRAFHDGCAP